MSFCPTDRLADDKMESSKVEKEQILIESMNMGERKSDGFGERMKKNEWNKINI